MLRGVVGALERQREKPEARASGWLKRGPILVFDSGIGGLSVLRAIARAPACARFVYVADDAAFPYGAWEEAALSDHIVALMGGLIAEHRPAAVVIACNTASTLVLPPLRARFACPSSARFRRSSRRRSRRRPAWSPCSPRRAR